MSREIRLVARPQGFPDEDLFEIAETPIPDPGEGQLLVRNAYFSVDPYMRPRMNDVRSYVAPFTLGEAMTGGAVGRVAASRNERYAEGDWVLHGLGWREWALSDGSGLRKIDPEVAPDLDVARRARHARLHGVLRAVRPRAAEGGRDGLRLGSGGSSRQRRRTDGEDRRLPRPRLRRLAEKVAWLRELGFDDAFDYRERSVREALAEAAPDGIDIYFDNVGGDSPRGRRSALCRTHGRVVACGSISRYNDVEPAPGPRNMFMVVTKRLRIQGYIISDHYEHFPEFLRRAHEWVSDGRLRYRETVIEGIENAPSAFMGLLRGENIGKMLVKVGPDT